MKRQPQILTIEDAIASLWRKYPWAEQIQLEALAEDQLDWMRAEQSRRPLTFDEVADRWYSYDAVIWAISKRQLRPLYAYRGPPLFDWLHVLAVDIPIARMHRKAHPDCATMARRREALEITSPIQEALERKRRARISSTHIYFVASELEPVCKIGQATDLKKRLSALRTMSPVPLRLVAFTVAEPAEEFRLHQKFAEERLHGEWFQISDRVSAHIAVLRHENGLPDWAAAS